MDAIDSGVITNAEVGLVISNNPGAYALKRAESRESRLSAFRRNLKIEKNFIESASAGIIRKIKWSWSYWQAFWWQFHL